MNSPTNHTAFTERGGPVSCSDVDLDWTGSCVTVSWRCEDGPWIVSCCEATWEPGDRSCGVGDGFIVEGDWVPEDVASLICEEASERQRNQYEDAMEQRAEWREEAGW